MLPFPGLTPCWKVSGAGRKVVPPRRRGIKKREPVLTSPGSYPWLKGLGFETEGASGSGSEPRWKGLGFGAEGACGSGS